MFKSKVADRRIESWAAKVNITPTHPVRLSGYEARSEPFKGVHDDLFVSASVFDNGDLKTCIITADVIGFSHQFTDETRALIEKETRISAMNVMITAVHNHSTPMTGVYTKTQPNLRLITSGHCKKKLLNQPKTQMKAFNL